MKICCSDSLIFCWIWEHFDKILTHFSFCSLRRFIWSKFWAANDDLSQLLVASSTRFKLLKAFQSGSHSQRGHQRSTNAKCILSKPNLFTRFLNSNWTGTKTEGVNQPSSILQFLFLPSFVPSFCPFFATDWKLVLPVCASQRYFPSDCLKRHLSNYPSPEPISPTNLWDIPNNSEITNLFCEWWISSKENLPTFLQTC